MYSRTAGVGPARDSITWDAHGWRRRARRAERTRWRMALFQSAPPAGSSSSPGAEALRYLEKGHARGKVVITV